MADKRGNWSKNELREIWNDYVKNKVWDLYDENWLNDYWDLNNEAPCPYQNCLQEEYEDGKMLRAQYEGKQNGNYQWSVDHINGNARDNNIKNLQPMHPQCNKDKN